MTERVERWCRGLASLALLVGLVVGVPAALLVLGGDPLPHRWDPAGLWDLLLRPDDGTVLARLLALVGWLAWGVFTLSLVVELANLVRRRSRDVVLPGLGGIQQWAAGLMLAVVALGAAAQLTSGPAAPTAVSAPVVAGTSAGTPSAVRSAPETAPRPAPTHVPSREATDEPRAGTAAPAAPHGRHERVHTVQVGDDLWSLAERYYGRGQEWRRIAAANPDRLTGGPDRLRPGWRLVVPEDGSGDPVSTGEDTVRVRRGDTLTSVAERVLGDGDRWRELYRANRAQLDDPDDLPVGLVLQIPGRASASPDRAAEDRSESDGEHAEDASRGQAEQARGSSSPEPAPPTTSAPPAASQAPPTTSAPPAASEAPATPTESAGVPTGTAPARGETAAADAGGTATVEDGSSLLVPGLATVGGLLAAALLGGLAARRRWQLRHRPVGRRITHPAPSTRPVEVALAHRARPIGLRTLDRASRSVAAAATEAGVEVPALRTASVSDEWLVLELSGPTPPAPPCFVDTGGTWCLSAEAATGLRDVPGLGEAPRPWPLLVTLGVDDLGAERVVDLESLGLLAVTGEHDLTTATLAAMALELACSPWTDELRLTLVGDDRLTPALAQHNVQTAADVDDLLDRLERTSRERREHAGGRDARDLRLDPDLGEAWTPEVVLVDVALSPEQALRLARLTTGRPGTGVTAVVRGPQPEARLVLALEGDSRATLLPEGVRLVPQALPAVGLDPVVELVAATGSTETSPAPWWSEADPPEPPPDNVTYLGRRRRTDERDEQERRAAVEARITEAADGTADHPLLQLIGPVDLLGATGPSTQPGSQAVPGVLRLAAGEPGEHGSGDGPGPPGRRGHAAVEHEPAPHLARCHG